MTETTVLLVEDDPAQAALIRRAFAAAGTASVDHAGTGLEGIAMFDRLHPSVVVVDVMLPLMNGVDVARTIHSHSPGTIVVGYSSVAHLSREVDRAAFDAWLERRTHTEAAELVTLVHQTVDRRQHPPA